MSLFPDFLQQQKVNPELADVLEHISQAVKYINFSLRAGNTHVTDSVNPSGEDQLKLDVISDKIASKELAKCEFVSIIASEEQEGVQKFQSPKAKYGVSFDPLDGSSLVNANLAIGSIFGVWDCDDFLGKTGREHLVASMYAMYGPRITIAVALKGNGVYEFELNDVGEFILVQEHMKLKLTSKYFAPGNLRATVDNPKYLKLVEQWIADKRTLRYSGGMVPDLNHILCKGEGIFTYPRDAKHTNGKLRLLYECAPFAFLFEESGGAALDQEGVPILDKKIEDIHQRTTLFIGSAEDVKAAVTSVQ